MEVTHLDIRNALRGASFPADADDLERVSRTNLAEPEVIDLLEHLPDGDEYDSIEDVLDELNVDHSAIDDTTELRVALGMEDGEDLEDADEIDLTEREDVATHD